MFGAIILSILLFFPSQAVAYTGITPARGLLSSEQISLESRQGNKYINEVFKDNILLNIAYMTGRVKREDDINWNEVRKPFSYKFTLLQQKTFAFHDDVLPKYKSTLAITTKAHFNLQEGFRSDGYLAGDGVCHLASLIYWVSKEADLDTYVPTNHNFAVIPEISKEYGVSIYSMPGLVESNAKQNLYVTNNRQKPVVFEFDYDGENLKLSIYEKLR